MTKLTKQQQEMVREFEEKIKEEIEVFFYNDEDNVTGKCARGIKRVLKQFLLDQVRKARERDLEILEGVRDDSRDKMDDNKGYRHPQMVAEYGGYCKAVRDAQEAIKKEMEGGMKKQHKQKIIDSFDIDLEFINLGPATRKRIKDLLLEAIDQTWNEAKKEGAREFWEKLSEEVEIIPHYMCEACNDSYHKEAERLLNRPTDPENA